MAKKAVKKVANKYGIKETKEMLRLVVAIGKTLVKAKENDGNIDMGDLSLLVNLFPVISPAFEGSDLIVKELKDLDAKELKELVIFSAAHLGEFAKKDEKLLEQIEAGLKAVLSLIDFIAVFKK